MRTVNQLYFEYLNNRIDSAIRYVIESGRGVYTSHKMELFVHNKESHFELVAEQGGDHL